MIQHSERLIWNISSQQIVFAAKRCVTTNYKIVNTSQLPLLGIYWYLLEYILIKQGRAKNVLSTPVWAQTSGPWSPSTCSVFSWVFRPWLLYEPRAANQSRAHRSILLSHPQPCFRSLWTECVESVFINNSGKSTSHTGAGGDGKQGSQIHEKDERRKQTSSLSNDFDSSKPWNSSMEPPALRLILGGRKQWIIRFRVETKLIQSINKGRISWRKNGAIKST